MPETVEIQLKAAVDAIVGSGATKKIVVAGPGAGKTWLFQRLLEADGGEPDAYLVLTFINNLKNDLERDLADRARVYTFHGYCRRLLHRKPQLRTGLTEDFYYFPPLASLIRSDWELTREGDVPQFVGLMRELNEGEETNFYLERANYYDAVAFDDSVFRVYRGLEQFSEEIEQYRLLLVDEYQDFNRLEAAFIRQLATVSPTVITGDDDQALYSQLRGSSARFIREVYTGGEYEAFPLPFCMRCTQPIVEAVSDIIRHAQIRGKLQHRLKKPYLFYPPKKGADTKLYPRIKVVETSVQSLSANYFGRYVEQEIRRIPPEDVDESTQGHFPAVLVIGPIQYLRQIKDHLEKKGYPCKAGEGDNPVEVKREDGLRFLKDDSNRNLGWRVLLEVDQPSFIAEILRESISGLSPMVELIPLEYKVRILSEMAQIPDEANTDSEDHNGAPKELLIRLTSFEGSKGLSAQHVFIVGLHNGDLPRDPANITDLEICKFLVALTRTRKQCHLLYTNRWSGRPKQISAFLRWISPKWVELIKVTKAYWT